MSCRLTSVPLLSQEKEEEEAIERESISKQVNYIREIFTTTTIIMHLVVDRRKYNPCKTNKKSLATVKISSHLMLHTIITCLLLYATSRQASTIYTVMSLFFLAITNHYLFIHVFSWCLLGLQFGWFFISFRWLYSCCARQNNYCELVRVSKKAYR